MDEPYDWRRIEMIDPRVAALLRTKSQGERMRAALDMNEFVRRFIIDSLRSRHPDWSEERLRDELFRRLLGDTARPAETRV